MNRSYWIILCLTLYALSTRADPEPLNQDTCLHDDLCRAQYTLARELSKNGRLIEALTAYDAAYQRRPVPILLFNIARLHHRLSHFSDAIRFYSRYLETQPPNEEEQRTRARQFLAEATQQLQQTSQLPQPSSTPASPPSDVSPKSLREDGPADPLRPEPNPSSVQPQPIDPSVPPSTKLQPPTPSVQEKIPIATVTLQSPIKDTLAKERRPIYKKWWFWTVMGTVAAGAIVGITTGVVVASHHSVPALPTDEMCYRPFGAGACTVNSP